MEKRMFRKKDPLLPEWPGIPGSKGDPYFPHEADIGIETTGKTLEEAFVHAAEATFSLMTDPATVHSLQMVDLSFTEPDEELALTIWINRLLAESDIRRLVFGRFELKRNTAGHWHGRAIGEPWNDTHPRGIEVKGATLTQLSVKHEGDLWTVRLVVDV